MFSVRVGVAWPNRAATVRRSTPARIRWLAWVWRRTWKVSPSTPTRRVRAEKARWKLLGHQGAPFSPGQTSPWSVQASPSRT